MTEPAPARALEHAFRAVLDERMRGLPLVNDALRVEAVGFRPWGGHWLGVLVTPWFMNLVLLPLDGEAGDCPRIGESASHAFPAGVFDFIGAHDARAGAFQSCSLFSPMFEFADQDVARGTALAALDALFDSAHRPAPEEGATPLTPGGGEAESVGEARSDGVAGGGGEATSAADAAGAHAPVTAIDRDAGADVDAGRLGEPPPAVSKRDFLRGDFAGRHR